MNCVSRCVCVRECVNANMCMAWLRLVGSLKIIGLFCKRDLQKRRYSAKETYIFKKPTHPSYPILKKKMWEWYSAMQLPMYEVARDLYTEKYCLGRDIQPYEAMILVSHTHSL